MESRWCSYYFHLFKSWWMVVTDLRQRPEINFGHSQLNSNGLMFHCFVFSKSMAIAPISGGHILTKMILQFQNFYDEFRIFQQKNYWQGKFELGKCNQQPHPNCPYIHAVGLYNSWHGLHCMGVVGSNLMVKYNLSFTILPFYHFYLFCAIMPKSIYQSMGHFVNGILMKLSMRFMCIISKNDVMNFMTRVVSKAKFFWFGIVKVILISSLW